MGLVRAALLTFAVTAAGFTLATAGADPAMAMCKYGSGQCVDPHPNFDFTLPEDIHIPEDNWIDPDCEHYGNCHTNLETADTDEDQGLGTFSSFSGVLKR